MMVLHALMQQLTLGLASGAVYSLIALSLVMVHASTGQVNFAQGQIAVFSAFVCWQLLQLGLSMPAAIAVTLLLSFLLGSAIDRLVLQHLQGKSDLANVVVFVGLLTFFHALCGTIWSHTIKKFPSPFSGSSLSVSFMSEHDLGMFAVVSTVLVCVFVFIEFTSLGLAMRASAQNPTSSRLNGISVDRMRALGWGLATTIGAIAGILIAPTVFLEPNMMSGALLYGFAGALVGGIDSAPGAVIGGFLVGILENLVGFVGLSFYQATGIYVVGNGEKLSVALMLVFVILMVKPNGLFGRKLKERV